MKTAEIEIEDKTPILQNLIEWQLNKIDELLIVLDVDIRHIQQTLSRLNELRSFVVKRDDISLAKLLETIQADMDSYNENELKRRSILKKLAKILNCSLEQMTLSKLQAVIPEQKKVQIAERKAKLISLTKELKREHLNTTLLLSECARFNNMLLKSIFDLRGTETVMYGSDGHTKRQDNIAFVNLRF
jgi:hypothetical protein